VAHGNAGAVTAPPDLARPGPASAPLPHAERRAPRALLAEDEPVVGELLAEFLELEGYEVDRARDGRQALELVRRHVYTLIVSDVRMPDVDGPAFYYQLRALRPELTRRMVFVTGDITNADTRRFLDEACLRYLEKPFTIAAFQAVVQGVLTEPPFPEGRAPSAPS
jgi:CheY-like chemotaxis protein